jgi:hypothetical protein
LRDSEKHHLNVVSAASFVHRREAFVVQRSHVVRGSVRKQPFRSCELALIE